MLFSKRKRIIKKSIKNALQSVVDIYPKIYEYFFYGAYDLSPEFLVIWYLFETDEELNTAKDNGLCLQLLNKTTDNLIAFGYPLEAIDVDKKYGLNEKIKIQGTNEEIKNQIVDVLNHRKISVSFTTKEDIDKTANGDYHLYFQ